MADYDVKAVLSAVDQGFTSALDKANDTLKGFGNQAEQASSTIKSSFSGIKGTLSGVEGTISGFKEKIGNVTAKLDAVKNSVGEFASKTGTAMSVAGAGITAFGMNQLKSFGDYQSSLNQASVIAGGTSKDIDQLSKVANKMGADLPLSAKQCSDAMVGMAKNGASISDIKKEFPAIAKASTAAGSDISATADAVMQSMNIWGGDASKNAAILVQTANQSNASVDSMGQAFSNVGSTAKMLHMPLSTTAEAIGLLTNHGKSSAQASQDLNHALLAMMKPSSKAQDVMKQLGITYTDAHGRMLPFRTILGELSDKLDGLAPKQRAAAEATMFGTSGMSAMEPLIQSITAKAGDASNNWDAYALKQNEAAGSVDKANKTLNGQAKDMQQNLGSALEQVGGNWDSLKNTAMQSSSNIYTRVANDISNLEDKLTKTKNPIGQFVRNFLGIMPALGPALTAMGTVTTVIGNLAQLNPAVLVLTALGAALSIIIARSPKAQKGIKDFFKSFDNGNLLKDTQDEIKKIGEGIKRMIDTMTKNTNVKALFSGLKTLFGSLYDALKQILGVIPGIGDAFQKNGKKADVWSKIGKTFADIFNDIGKISGNIGTMISNFLKMKPVQQIFQIIHDTLKNIYDRIKFIIDIAGNFVRAFTQGKQAQAVWQAIADIFKNINDFIGYIIDDVGHMLKKFEETKNVNKVVQSVATELEKVRDKVKLVTDILKKLIDSITKNVDFKALFNGIKTLFTSVWDVIQQLVQAIPGVGDLFQQNGKKADVWEKVGYWFSTILDNIGRISKDVGTMITNMLKSKPAQEMFKALHDALQGIYGFIKSIIDTAGDFIKAFTQGDQAKVIWKSIAGIFRDIFKFIGDITNDFGGMVKKFDSGKNMDKTVKPVATAFQTIHKYMKNIMDGMEQFIKGFTSAKNIQQLWGVIKDIFKNLWDSFHNILENLGVFSKKFSDTKSANNAWKQLGDKVAKMAKDLLKNIDHVAKFFKSVTKNKQAVRAMKKLAELVVKLLIIKKLSSPFTKFFKKFKGYFDSVRKLYNGFKTFKGTVEDSWKAIKKFHDKYIPSIKDMKDTFTKLKTAWDGGKGPINALKNAYQKANDVWKKGKNLVGTLREKLNLAEKAQKAWNTVTNLAKDAQIAFNVALDANPIGIVIGLVAALTAGLVWFFTQTKTGKKLWKDFCKGLKEELKEVKDFFSNVGKWFKNAFSGLGKWIQTQWKGFQKWLSQVFDPKKWGDIGKNIIAGIVQGMTNALRLIPGIGNKVADQIVGSTKSALGIHSPSRVMRDQVGYNVIRGITAGMSENGDMLSSASQNASNTLIGTLSDQIKSVNNLQMPLKNVIEEIAILRNALNSLKSGARAFNSMTSSIMGTITAMMRLNSEMSKNKAFSGQKMNIGSMVNDSINDAYDQVHTINFDNGDQVVDQNITLDQSDRPANINLTLGGQDFRAYIHNLGIATEAEARLRRVRGY